MKSNTVSLPLQNSHSQSKSRNLWIDTLRGLSAVWVVVFHINEVIPSGNPYYKFFVGLGYLGVPVFFVISGYCVWASALRSKGYKEFLWRRFFRIYPPFIASLLLVVAVCVVRKLLAGQNDLTALPDSLLSWLATLSLTTSPVSSVGTVNWVYWSLSYEVAFYLIVAIGMSKQSYRLWVIYSLLALSLVPTLQSFPGFFFLDRFGIFTIGIGISMLTQNNRKDAFGIIALSLTSIIFNSSLLVQFVIFVTALSLWISDHRKTWLNCHNTFTDLGLISYSLYLIHVPLGCYLLLRFTEGLWNESLLPHLVYDASVTLVCIFFSFAFYYYIEKPSALLGKRFVSLLSISNTSES